MLGANEHMDPKLFGREIIFEEFQRIWTRYLIVTDRQTDRQPDRRTDGRLTVASPLSALASRGKNVSMRFNLTIQYYQASVMWPEAQLSQLSHIIVSNLLFFSALLRLHSHKRLSSQHSFISPLSPKYNLFARCTNFSIEMSYTLILTRPEITSILNCPA